MKAQLSGDLRPSPSQTSRCVPASVVVVRTLSDLIELPVAPSLGLQQLTRTRPVHDQHVEPFSIDQHPVSSAQFSLFVADTRYMTGSGAAALPVAVPRPGSRGSRAGCSGVRCDVRTCRSERLAAMVALVDRCQLAPSVRDRLRYQRQGRTPSGTGRLSRLSAYASWALHLPKEAEWGTRASRQQLDLRLGRGGQACRQLMANTWQGSSRTRTPLPSAVYFSSSVFPAMWVAIVSVNLWGGRQPPIRQSMSWHRHVVARRRVPLNDPPIRRSARHCRVGPISVRPSTAFFNSLSLYHPIYLSRSRSAAVVHAGGDVSGLSLGTMCCRPPRQQMADRMLIESCCSERYPCGPKERCSVCSGGRVDGGQSCLQPYHGGVVAESLTSSSLRHLCGLPSSWS